MQMVWGLNHKQFCGGFKGLPPTNFGASVPRLYAGFATKGLKKGDILFHYNRLIKKHITGETYFFIHPIGYIILYSLFIIITNGH